MDPATHQGTGDLPGAYRAFARLEARGTSAVYERWAKHISADPHLLHLLAALPPAKRQPNLVLAAARLADHWISSEGPRVLAVTEHLADAAGRDFVVTLDGTPRAFAEPHGRHLRGLEDAAPVAAPPAPQ